MDRQTGLTGDDVTDDGRLVYSTQTGDSTRHDVLLICWDHRHYQLWSQDDLRAIVIAPWCTAGGEATDLCESPIWAVEHEGEPRRYVGRPPHVNWQSWADCTPVKGDVGVLGSH